MTDKPKIPAMVVSRSVLWEYHSIGESIASALIEAITTGEPVSIVRYINGKWEVTNIESFTI